MWGNLPAHPGDTIPMISKLVSEQKQSADDLNHYHDYWKNIMVQKKERVLVIPACQLLSFLAGRIEVELPPEIPGDSLALRAYQDDNPHNICLVLFHPVFPVVKPGFAIPRFDLVIKVLEPDWRISELHEAPETDPEERTEREI